MRNAHPQGRKLMQFVWDEQKSQSNLAKHRVSFAFAARVFDDPHVMSLGF